LITSANRHRSYRARSGRVLGICVAFALAAAACGGGDSDDTTKGSVDAVTDTTDASSPEPSSSDATGTTDDTTPTATDAPAPEPVIGGTAVVGMVFDAFGLDPTTFVGSVADGVIANSLYDPLMRLTEEGVPEPFLAKSVETDDQQKYTITLNEGISFQDGTPFDAEAVKVNIERHMDPESRSRSLVNAKNIESITVVDELTVELDLKFPWVAFQNLLTGNLGLMASPTAIAAGTISEKPVGTGPFMLQERVPGDRTVVVRNPDYWVEGEPYLDSIMFRSMPDDKVRQTSVENNEIQLGQSSRADTLAGVDAPEGIYATASPRRVSTIHINNTAAPFDDVRVRRALAFALDYDAINQVIYKGEAGATHSFISEDSPFFDDTAEYPDYDPDKAAELVAEYEAENGPIEFTFRCYNDPSRVQLTELASQMWRSAGIDVETEISDQITLVIDLLQGNYTVGCFAMGIETDDPDAMWYGNFHSESSSNYVKFPSPEMDAALDTGRTTADEATRKEAYSVVQQLLANETPLIQYSSSPWGWVVREEMGGAATLPGGEFVPSQLFFTD
jgi:peptide/nickel transport system substrate-binding protein